MSDLKLAKLIIENHIEKVIEVIQKCLEHHRIGLIVFHIEKFIELSNLKLTNVFIIDLIEKSINEIMINYEHKI